eukprot:490853-Prymnesium_polylepis.1
MFWDSAAASTLPRLCPPPGTKSTARLAASSVMPIPSVAVTASPHPDPIRRDGDACAPHASSARRTGHAPLRSRT